ncbi:MAG TPA: hypothetical protein VF647_26210 [Longimicrobium sp.]
MNHPAPRPDDTVASPPRRGPGENPFAGLALLLAVAGVVPPLRTVAWVLAALSGALAIGYAVGRAGAGRVQLGLAVGVVVLTFLATPPPNRAAYRDVASADTVEERTRESDTPDAPPREENDEESPAPPTTRPAEPPAERVASREPERRRERPKPRSTPRTTPKPKPKAAPRTEPRTAPRTRPKTAPRTEPRRAPTPPAEVATRSTRTTESRTPRSVTRRTTTPLAEAPTRRTPDAPPRRTRALVAAPSARELSEVRADLAVAQVLKNQGAYYDAGATLRNAQRNVSALSARYPGSPAVSELSERVRTLAAENRRACFAEATVLRSRGEATSPCP